MKRFWIPALVMSAVFSANAFAYHDDCDEEGGVRYERSYRPIVKRQIVYEEPVVVYREPRRVEYRERIVYRDRPVYYQEPEVRYYEQPRSARGYDGRYDDRYYEERPTDYRRNDGNRALGQVVGAVAGGVIGNQIGRGSGRVAATAVGAVLGGVLGGRVADEYPY
ncbi:glycine zipper 2TM domain-containing protein [Aromatoleum toluvorans]|uniref:Glycine zipper 2TM domain-containing protein n=1 Tax=Aromatoleum toluvorans TaxID=92002 RepID=A0ABX1PZ23_9RHOO|nr:glycine zipper 2TM domain-containing protein [Aromatoleum toluvorans]NMG43872.1 glycine zipper 2TM domain-containing protein [Aromatoleum toluvorans]